MKTNMKLSEIALANLEKLCDRSERDALRDLDSGEISPDSIVIIAGKLEPGNKSKCTYYQSSKNQWEMLGLIEEAKLELLR